MVCIFYYFSKGKLKIFCSSSLNSLAEDLSGEGDYCISGEDCNCFPWAHHKEFYAVSFSPPGRAANPIVRDKRFLVDAPEHLDGFSVIRSDRKEMVFYNSDSYSASGDAETDYMVLFA